MSKLLSPMKIGRNKFKNRVVMAPMCMFHSKTVNGVLTKEHFDHYVARALIFHKFKYTIIVVIIVRKSFILSNFSKLSI